MTSLLNIKRLHPEAILPSRSTPDSAGLDVSTFLISNDGHQVNAIIPPYTTKIFRTGLVVAPVPGHVILVCSRSSLASQSPPLFVANAPGVVDPDYTGELKILIYNGGFSTAYFRHGQKIAQLLVVPYLRLTVQETTDELPKTVRGEKGFGEATGDNK